MNIHLRAALQTAIFLASVIGFWAVVFVAPLWASAGMVIAVVGFSVWKLFQANVETLRIKQEQKPRDAR